MSDDEKLAMAKMAWMVVRTKIEPRWLNSITALDYYFEVISERRET